ncbi:MAG: isopentenyl-diphosphate Delta-isomerase [Pyrinomonadaceae bacterium]|nr:isopentenyl-diphosphate Delta-isomerase [Pyrinomonadaceae bacterium]
MQKYSRQNLIIFSIVLVALAVSAFFMVNVELPPWSHYLSGVNVVLFAIPAFWATRRWLGWRDALGLWATLGIYALLLETSAIYTGFPYGHFGYSELLGAKLFGVTPWTVFLAWTPLIVGAYAVARVTFGNVIVRVIATAMIATLFDLVLDPGAVRLGFWQYAANIGFYGVPISNFVGWLVSGTLAAIVIELYLWRAKPLLRIPVQMVSSAFLIVFFWTAIAVFGGMVWPAVIGAGIVIWLAVYWIQYHYRFDDMLVYVDDAGTPIATEAKPLVHHADTKLHLAFSIFLFNSKGELLLQQRALSKKTWPGVWSNSCCGHVMLHERTVDAAKRRLKFELGFSGLGLNTLLPDFRYRAEKDGVVENEICPVLVGFTDKLPRPNPDEVAATRNIAWADFLELARDPNGGISPWAREEAELLEANEEFRRLFAANCTA